MRAVRTNTGRTAAMCTVTTGAGKRQSGNHLAGPAAGGIGELVLFIGGTVIVIVAGATTDSRPVIGEAVLVVQLNVAITVIITGGDVVVGCIAILVEVAEETLVGTVMITFDIAVGISRGCGLVTRTHAGNELRRKGAVTTGTFVAVGRRRILVPLALPGRAVGMAVIGAGRRRRHAVVTNGAGKARGAETTTDMVGRRCRRVGDSRLQMALRPFWGGLYVCRSPSAYAV